MSCHLRKITKHSLHIDTQSMKIHDLVMVANAPFGLHSNHSQRKTKRLVEETLLLQIEKRIEVCGFSHCGLCHDEQCIFAEREPQISIAADNCVESNHSTHKNETWNHLLNTFKGGLP